MKRNVAFSLMVLFLLSVAVSCKAVLVGEPIHLMSWNVQNLFDGVSNGGEYREFDPAQGKWNESLFHDRLKNISEIILESNPPFGPDIVVLMEIENANCLEQLNRFYLPQCRYRTPLISKNPKGVQTALLTRLPILSIKSYRFSALLPLESIALRDIVEVELETPKGNCFLFINHWKSRLGGEEKTEYYRLQSATLLSHRLKELSDSFERITDSSHKNKRIPPIIVCGDFNETLNPFDKEEGKRITALLPFDEKVSFEENQRRLKSLSGYQDFVLHWGIEPAPLFFCKAPDLTSELSPLFTSNPFNNSDSSSAKSFPLLYNLWNWEKEAKGSYFFREKWECLDHFFVNEAFWQAGNLKLLSFKVIQAEKLLNANGTPKKWITSIRKGYSDHLPLLLEMQ